MKTSTKREAAGPGHFATHWKTETLALLALALLAGWCIATSWRKWPDPISDAGAQWFAFWRLSQGARLYHDFTWNYGPLSAWFNTWLFKWFGPGMMVLATANLVIWFGIAALAHLAFRKAWGSLGAFAALAAFIVVFSFSRLNGIGNYNYATPYANESTHGMLLLLVTVWVAARWCRGPSRWLAFFLGLCGGLMVVLKPEFMLAGGLLGIAAWVVRLLQRQRAGIVEHLLIVAGLALPTLAFTVTFALGESPWQAFVDASQAWWLVLVDHQMESRQQSLFLGLDQPWAHVLNELTATVRAVAAIGAIWSAGWIANRPWKLTIKAAVVLAAGVLAYDLRPELPPGIPAGGWANGWLFVGACFPGMMLLAFIVTLARAARQFQQTGRVEEGTTMALALVLAAGAMLARMPLLARIDHLGFYQAALAGMVTAAIMTAEVPRWTGEGAWGRRLATAGSLAALTAGCVMVAKMSHAAHGDQTVGVGSGRDRFYCDAPDIDATGSLVEWTVECLRSTPPEASVWVMPEGAMINYLLRRTNLVMTARGDERVLMQLRRSPPDYVVEISRNLNNGGVTRYGHPGESGYPVVEWLAANYAQVASRGGDPLDSAKGRGAIILQRKPPAAPQTVTPAGAR